MSKHDGVWEILIPRYGNDGTEYSLGWHREWDARVRSMAGGVTIQRTAKGHWVDPKGVLFVEEMIPVKVYCSEDVIKEIIGFTMAHYDQEAVMAYLISERVLLVHRNELSDFLKAK